MDNISNISQNFKSFIELQEYCDAQFAVAQALAKENEKLKAEIEHLKSLLAGATPLLKPEVEQPAPKLQVSTEQAILEMQIEKMRQDAMVRQLTLEETKRLDLLIKNLHLVKGQATQITENKLPFNISETDLLRIATQPEASIDE
jgi:hypothetical protein